MKRPDLRTYQYQQLRLSFLATQSSCYWCGATNRKLTVDHVVPVAFMHEGSGLTPLDVGNWVAACGPCNARRGAQITNARRRRTPRRGKPQMGYAPSREW